MEESILNLIRKYPVNRKENLLPLLQDIQLESGYLPEEVLQQISRHLSIPINKIYGVATFYDEFRFRPLKEPVSLEKVVIPAPPLIPDELKTFLLVTVIKNVSDDYRKEEREWIAQLRREKVQKPVIYVGTGSCGTSAGALETYASIRSYINDREIDVDLIEVGCIGLCSEEPIVDVHMPGKNRLSFRKITHDKVEAVLDSVFSKNIYTGNILGQHASLRQEAWANVISLEQHPWFLLQQRNILKNAGITSPFSITDYIVNGGYKALYKTVLNYIPEKVCDIIEQSELRGRSGSGFLTGKKWKVALGTAGEEKYFICNADESDPGAFIDRAVIESDPHLLVEGLAIGAYAIGASNAYIYIRSNYPRAVEILTEAVRQAKELGIIGTNIFGSGYNLNILIRKGAGAFICGEETALIKSLEGRRGMPQSKPPYPAESGLFGRPTVVNNVETLANVPAIIEKGPVWFRNTGTKNSKGTKLFSLKGNVNYRGFIEVPMGIRLNEIIMKIGGGIRDNGKFKAIQIGGPLGVCLPESLTNLEISFETLKEAGALIGSGGLEILDESTCMVELTHRYMDFLHNESCGKCIPCREGTARMVEILDIMTRRPKEESSHETLERFKGVVHMESLAEVIHDTSLCGLGQNAANPLLSSLRWFREEFEEHIFDRRCKAGVCRDLRTFYIDVDACNGCNVCPKKCPEDAIIGTLRMPHFIVEEKCTGCGECFESCKFNAIFIK